MKKVFNLSLLFAALVMIGFASCKPVEPNVAVTGVTVSPTTLSLSVGGTSKLTATVAPSNATNKNVTWASSNTAVATVDASGTVKGVAAGTATITVTTADGKKTNTCAVTVTAGGGGTTGTVECDLLGQPLYLGDANGKVPGKHLYQVAMVPKGTTDESGKAIKAGTLYVFILSGAAPSGSNFNPATGDYAWAEGYGSMTVSAESSFWRPFDASGAFTSEPTAFTAGTFTLAADKFSFVGTNSDGTVNVAYSGSYTFKDGTGIPESNYKGESTEKTTYTETLPLGAITDAGDFYKSGTKDLFAFFKNSEPATKVLLADFFISLSSTTFTPGTYTINNTKAEMTMLASQGWPQGVTESWKASSFYAEGTPNTQGGLNIEKIYFIVSGTATVTANKLEIAAKSYYGSTINITYTGDMTLKQPQGVLKSSKKAAIYK